ncbi:NRDE family protein [Halosolutus gelatinilyticus]|uniref:NRDE family protein n=1 Tax=Halosolutus gelatinilyticus TaxID=2931975 RepID=UPI001FF281B5|nr:NRDE family protein [Halosolutus gelatinilyticus]
MCTLTLAWRAFDEAPIAVAANRDERLDRESIPPGVYREDPFVIAPQDAEAGGTWIGYNEFGVFAGVTNRWTDADLAGDRSRGLLVADVLEAESAAEAATIVEETTDEYEYEGFYLVVADASDAFCFRWEGDLRRTTFEPGVHVVVNVAVDDDAEIPSIRRDAARQQAANARAVRAELAARPNETATEWLDRAGEVLGDHEYGVCIHGDGFGTRSSSLLAIGAEPRYRYAPGPPCVTDYERVDLGDGASEVG